ncbi:MAG: DUF2116 family Zn-ribbon domain-containing protein [Methanomassiliicoccales archaeon]
MKCPICGTEVPFGEIECPPCSQRLANNQSKRPRKRLILVAAIVIVMVVVIALAIPAISDWSRTPTQKYIISGSDLGAGWSSTAPVAPQGSDANASNSAEIWLYFENGTSSMKGVLLLSAYSNTEKANVSYQETLTWLMGYFSGERFTLTNISEGDRGMISSSSGQQVVIMQKGQMVFTMSIMPDWSPNLSIAQLQEIAHIQASKIP